MRWGDVRQSDRKKKPCRPGSRGGVGIFACAGLYMGAKGPLSSVTCPRDRPLRDRKRHGGGVNAKKPETMMARTRLSLFGSRIRAMRTLAQLS